MSVISRGVARLPAGIWVLDPVHSSVGFSVTHMVVSTFRSHFDEFSANLAVKEDGSARLAGTVASGSIAVKHPEFAAHLAAPDFFDSQRYPDLRFESTLLRRDGAIVELDGLLSIKEHTLPLTAIGTVVDPHEDPFGHVWMGLELETHIDRRQYGLEWNMALPKGGFALGNEVKLQVSLAFTRST
jgi:polyisoprenoid-binding protein YceI